jgi:hypothetical protein
MSVPAWATRGAKVVCVRDFREARIVDDIGHRGMPELGKVYVIFKAEVDRIYHVPVVYLTEFPSTQGFDLVGFRPAVEPKTEAEDVALFHDIARQKLPVDA